MTPPAIIAAICFVTAAALYHAELHVLAFITAIIGLVLIAPIALAYLGLAR
ncbi:MAG TPA: hypothetical protein VFZ26_05545 [Gemmatimonadales bacterium]